MASKTREAKRHTIAKAEEIPPGERKVLTVAGREMGVFNVGGSYYALRNICPHRGAPLCHGRLRPLVTSSGVHHIDQEREGEILKCPWHQWEFDIATGRALFDDKLRVKTYEVKQEGDEVVVYL
jgi:nitrite reductase/ring-hydroxylating ferredoxin subunit